ncbi:MAG: SWIM zinc finger family protein [Steroidobacteraceae bacterium]
MSWGDFDRKPTVQEQRRNAARESQRLTRSGGKLSPVVIEGRAIASSVWGKAWCANLESYRDFEYRLPRGRSYVRHRAVIDLKVSAGQIAALVCGSEVYNVQIAIKPLAQAHWGRIKAQCAGQVGSIIELLEGRLSDSVMHIITHHDTGLFPKPTEIQMDCSCPDSATMCKHVAAVMYGVGARLDHEPELLFVLRNTDHADLIAQATDFEATRRSSGRKTIADDALGNVFGIELDFSPKARPQAAVPRRKAKPAGVLKGRRKSSTSKR